MVLLYRFAASCIASGINQTCLRLVALLQVFTQAGVVPSVFRFIFCDLYTFNFYLDVSHTIGEHGICCCCVSAGTG